jgi:protein gp37
MAANSSIEWTDATWNPVTGCDKISTGCKNCYAAIMAKRLQLMGSPKYRNAFKLTLHPEELMRPLHWRKPQRVFVNSMSDLLHQEVPLTFIQNVFDTMARASWHTFLILTKRADRLAEVEQELAWMPNIWMGVSVENADMKWRIDALRQTGAHIKFLSLEPLLGPLGDLDLTGIDWVIVGGESGPGARPMESAWVTEIRDQCIEKAVPFFFKQWGGVRKKRTGRLLEGREWNGMPAHPCTEPVAA